MFLKSLGLSIIGMCDESAYDISHVVFTRKIEKLYNPMYNLFTIDLPLVIEFNSNTSDMTTTNRENAVKFFV